MKDKGFSLHFTGECSKTWECRETWAEKKNNAIKWFFQKAKDCESKDCSNQLLYLPCKELLIAHIVSNGRDFDFFLIFRTPSLTFYN